MGVARARSRPIAPPNSPPLLSERWLEAARGVVWVVYRPYSQANWEAVRGVAQQV